MKALYFTDKHDHPFNEFSKPTKTGRTTLLDEHYKTYDWIAEQIVVNRPDVVINLGDTVLTIGYVDALTITCVQYGDQAVRRACREVGAKYFPMLGNHDIGNDATRTHVLPFIDGLVTEAQVVDNMFFFPFYRDWQVVWDQWKDRAAQCTRAFIHLDIVGARFNFASVSKDGISPSDFPSTCNVVAGHFHHPQRLAQNFDCIGSCMYRDFRDEIVDQPRGIVIDYTAGDGRFDTRRIENPHTSLYHTLHVSNDEELSLKLDAIKDKHRCHLRLTYPEDLDPFVRNYKDDFRSIKTIPLKEKRQSMIMAGSGQKVDNFVPSQVLDYYFQSNPPAKADILTVTLYQEYAHEVVTRVLGPTLKNRVRHHVKFVSLHAENFGPFQSLDVRFDENGVVYVDGLIQDAEADVSNGAGKSFIFEALHWCYFGDVIRNSKDLEGRVNADDVINDQAKSGCMVSIMQEVDGNEYQIMRTRKHREYGNDLRIWMSGTPVAQGTEASKKYLETVTGVDQSLFRHTTLLVDSLSTRFSQLSGRVRLELLENVIQLDLYDQLYVAVHEDLKLAKNEFDGVKTSLDRDKGIIAELRASRTSLSQNLTTVISDLEASISTKQLELSATVDEVERLDQDIKGREQQAQAVAKEVSTAQSAIPRFDEKRYRETTTQLTTDLTIMRRSLSDKQSMAKGVCPTCGKIYEPTPILASEIEYLTTQIATFDEALKSWQSWEVGERARIKVFETAAISHQQAYQSMMTKIAHLRQTKQPLELKMGALRSDIAETRRSLDSSHGQLQLLDARIASVETEMDTLSKRLEDLALRVEVRLYWDTGLNPKGGCRMTLLQDALSQLSEFAVDYSNLISNGRVSPMIFITPKGEVGFEVTHVEGQKKYGLSSSGQRRMVDLGIQMALARLSSRFSGFTSNLMILDEVEDKLDSSARRHLISLLEKLAEDEGKIILIASHNKDIKSYVDRTWLVTQTQGISRLSTTA